MQRTIDSLLKATGIGLLSGLVGGLWLFFYIQWQVSEQLAALPPDAYGQAASLNCAAGSAASALLILSLPAGALFGLLLGGLFLLLKSRQPRFR